MRLYYNGTTQQENAAKELLRPKLVPQETEIKLRVKNLRDLQRMLPKLGARAVPGKGGRTHEFNILFDTSERNLARREQLLRIRRETPQPGKERHPARKSMQARVTFKSPVKGRQLPKRHKVREEIETQVEKGNALMEIFAALGYRPWFRYEKFRTTLSLPRRKRWARGLLIELDETPIGTFLELEGPPRAIDRAARALGYSKGDYIVTNYLDLYREECRHRGQAPMDMVFRKGK